MTDKTITDAVDEHDQELFRNVHPAGWRNPAPAPCYNLVVIGAGTAGLVSAAGAAGLGAKVALIEERLFGGDCLNTGCVPSKALIRAARALHEARRGSAFGVTAGASFDFGKAMERMRRLRAGLSGHDSVERFSRELKVDVFLGRARFTGRDSVDVDGARLRFKKAVICTGSRPAIPPVPGLKEAGYLTNETVFRLTTLPASLAVIGGGPIGCELAQAFARMGSRVTLLERGDRLLPLEDRDAASLVARTLERDGVQVNLRATLLSVTTTKEEKVLSAESDGTARAFPAQAILVASGRLPNIEGLDLELAGVESDPARGVLVNDLLRTANPRIYAAGDICSPFRFTHAADAMARIVIANALFPARQKFSSLVIPSCIYTDPEVARVGIDGAPAAPGKGITTLTVPLNDIDRAVLDGDTEGFARVHLRKGSDRLLGATIVGRRAGEMIDQVTLSLVAGMGLTAMGRTIHPYPTLGEALRRLADNYNKSRLTPLLQKALLLWMKVRRII